MIKNNININKLLSEKKRVSYKERVIRELSLRERVVYFGNIDEIMVPLYVLV